MTTTIQINSTQVDNALAQLAQRTAHLQPAFNAIGVKIHRHVIDCFEHEKSPDGINWAALSPVTKIAKAKRAAGGQMMTKNGRHTTAKFTRAYLNGSILRDTGSMYASLGHNATDSHVEITIGQDYAPFHQFGTSKMVARPFFPSQTLPQAWEADVMDILNLYLSATP